MGETRRSAVGRPVPGRRTVSRRTVAVTTAALAASALAGPAAPGAAAPARGDRDPARTGRTVVEDLAGTARVPSDLSTRTAVSLISATPSMLMVDQPVARISHLLLGTPGSQLTTAVLPDAFEDAAASEHLDWDVADHYLYRPVTTEVGGARSASLHRYDLLSHAETTTGLTSEGEYLAAVGEGWLGRNGSSVVLHRGATMTEVLDDLDTAGGLADIADDATGAILAYPPLGLPDRRQIVYLDLVTFRIRQIASVKELGGVALSPGHLAWTTLDAGGTAVLHRQPRGGGETVTRRISSGRVPTAPEVAITDSSSLWRDESTDDLRLLSADSEASPSTVDMPGPSSGFGAVGTTYYTAVSGLVAGVAGVYTIDGGTGTVALDSRVAAPPAQIGGVAVSSGALTYAGDIDSTTPGLTVTRRRVSGTTSLTLSVPEVLGRRTSVGKGVSASAGRMLLGRPDGRWPVQVLDGGALRYEIASSRENARRGARMKVSGPYLLVDGAVYRADGRKALTLPTSVRDVDLYGSRVVYNADGAVRVRDLEIRKSANNPRTVASCSSCSVAAWGSRVAWASKGKRKAVVLDLATSDTRTVKDIAVEDIALGDEVLLWQSTRRSGWSARVDVLDLSRTTSVPVAVSDEALLMPFGVAGVLDDHRVAWVDRTGELRVAPLGFGRPHQPRMIGTFAPPAFSPDGDGASDVWEPQFDVSKPVEGIHLSIADGSGGTLRTLDGTGSTGSIRDLQWDGRDGQGTIVPDGTYTWTLVASAEDNEGSLLTRDGATLVTGRVTVDRSSLRTGVSAPAVNATASATKTFPVSWKAKDATSANPADTYDVRYRRVSASGSQVRYGQIVSWKVGTTKRSATFGPSSLPRGSAWQFSARTTDSAGNVGPWSSWRTSAVALDDRDASRRGSWRGTRNGRAYLATLSSTSAKGASLRFGGRAASTIRVVGARCPSCGTLRVYVDGRLVATVDSRASRTAWRRVLCTVSVHRGRHAVRLVASGRGQVVLDGVAYTP